MNVLILVAGIGARLMNATHTPKCLLVLGGQSLLYRYLDALIPYASRIDNNVLVVGYMGEMVQTHAKAHMLGGMVRIVDNPLYEHGSILSAFAALEYFDRDVMLMDGDVFFTPPLLDKLMESKHGNGMLIDTTSSNTGEEIMGGGDDTRIQLIARGMSTPAEIYGEWVGFARMSAKAAGTFSRLLNQQVGNGVMDEGYEDLLQRLVDVEQFNLILVDGQPWIEIDFPKDLEKALEFASKQLH